MPCSSDLNTFDSSTSMYSILPFSICSFLSRAAMPVERRDLYRKYDAAMSHTSDTSSRACASLSSLMTKATAFTASMTATIANIRTILS